MKVLKVYVLAALLLLCGQLSFAQETEKKEPSPEAKESANLKLDLQAARKAILESRSEMLKMEGQLIQLEVAIWNDARDKIWEELNQLFGCKYDLDRRACEQKSPAVKKE